MKLLVAADSLFLRTPDGNYWCKTIYGYKFWTRYTSVFNKVIIVSRCKDAKYADVEGYLQVDGPNVGVAELPYMRGMKQYITNYFSFRDGAKEAIKGADCALIRLPSVAAFMVLDYFKKTGKPYALEVVADPAYAYSENKLAKLIYTRKLKKAVKSANGVSYVTKSYLQNEYPHTIKTKDKERFTSHYSTIDLPKEYLGLPKDFTKNDKFKIVHTANSINNDNKGHTTVIKAAKKLRELNYNIEVTFIGDGSKRPYYEKMCRDMGMEKYISFTGLLSDPLEVRRFLLESDIFIFPTKAEGLPRAIIEAMATGLPCLSSPVNGIPELLKKDYLVDYQNVDAYVDKIKTLIENPESLNKMSEENLLNSLSYTSDTLQKRRNRFYTNLRNLAKNQ
ncbi:glycosyltransferase [Alteribacter lacisalsi]|nr:glycosyltransferase [Alteribacter lacisalsi]